ncbi:MAG: type II toxin-antitoxin system RelE/ParE family toxin [Prevotella sp.]|nr:type II toxin-antitoxin system RelE/ParE family toxin [Prevotella sp.]MBR1546871.1 type II toxin-antitoxin system RelE/ParE family toxin [Prevotella sp.]
MKVDIVLGEEFKRQFRRLAKKYQSLTEDFITFIKDLESDPLQGSDLGGGTRKVRMAIASKGKGKSGGARVITFSISQKENEILEITLLTIYDKGEISSVSTKFIKWLIAQLKDEE